MKVAAALCMTSRLAPDSCYRERRFKLVRALKVDNRMKAVEGRNSGRWRASIRTCSSLVQLRIKMPTECVPIFINALRNFEASVALHDYFVVSATLVALLAARDTVSRIWEPTLSTQEA